LRLPRPLQTHHLCPLQVEEQQGQLTEAAGYRERMSDLEATLKSGQEAQEVPPAMLATLR